ncbi:RNA polymerase sigma factor [Mucilaginibacter ginsenosidivorax]|uniref:RNA polymerase sigma-70 factor n=1 Tax=Mucilaginibacter ginsenosidivorax TaxID=862126 RepID=A0A5B8WAT2_9SPHI|nr:RNA polymerase sigma-70 factor [Mucilaginibacter ginsenosidivorax]QEC80539.1 RNA polymerase sigma-70 factor [Mucilaginibacter ginsenosidivorax]
MIAGDELAFARLFGKYKGLIYHFVMKYVHSPLLAEDLTQEIFIKLWENKSNLSGVTSFKSYLFTTAKNHTLNCMKAAFRSEAALGLVVNSFNAARNSTEDELIHQEYLAFLRRVLESLPPRTREIFYMCREQEKTYDEVAQELGISRNAVKNHMVASMKALSFSLKKELGISLTVFFAIVSR